MQVFKCKNCEKDFLRPQFQKYCSSDCYGITNIKLVINSCIICKKDIITKSTFRNKKTCSKSCFIEFCKRRTPYNKGNRKYQRVCGVCNNFFKTFQTRQVYCSKNCRFKIPAWNKGKSKYNSEEEKILAKREFGKKSYIKHIEVRLFKCRQFAFKRRNAIGSFTKEQWEKLKQKSNYCCLICKQQEPFRGQRCEKLTIDHIIPISKDGTNFIKNIQPLCLKCNIIKCNKLPITSVL